MSNEVERENAYEKTKERYYPIDKILSAITSYFGEDKKEIIAKLKETTPIFLVGKDMRTFLNMDSQKTVKEAFEKAYPDVVKSTPNYEEIVFNLNNQLSLLTSRHPYETYINFIVKYPKVLTELGFDPKQIIFKQRTEDESFKYVVKETDERKKLRDYLDKLYGYKEDRVTFNIFIDQIIQEYNVCAELKIYYEKMLPLRFGDENEIAIFNAGNDTKVEYDGDIPKLPNSEELSEDSKKFLQDLMQSKYLCDEWTEQIVVEELNKIFKRNYKDIYELMDDKSMEIFLRFRTTCSKAIDLEQFIEIAKDRGLTPSNKELDLDYQERTSCLLEENYNGCYRGNDKTIDLLFPAAICTIIHELLHALGHTKGDFTAFDEKSRGFNEVVNEFLSMKVLEKLKPEDFKDLKFDDGCNYRTGIDVLRKFLNKYENELKECQFSDAPKKLQELIGKKNFDTLMKYGNLIEETNYGKFATAINYNNKNITTMNEFLQIYEKDKSIINLVNKSELAKVQMFIEYNKFTEKLVDNHQEFKKGNITDFPVKEIDKEKSTDNEADNSTVTDM